MLNAYPIYWSRFVWKLLKPIGLIRAIVTMVKIASTGFQKAVNITKVKTPIAHGCIYKTISVNLSDIKRADLISGFKTDKIDRDVFKYFITGISAKGISVFCASPDNILGLLHVDFEEVDGIYFFKEYPTKFGVVNPRGGDHCTFCVAVGSGDIITGQNILNKFSNSSSDMINRVMDESFSKKSISNGFSLYPILSACGIVAPRTKCIVKKRWKEGNSYFVLTTDDKLLQDRNIDKELTSSGSISIGNSLTTNKNDSTLVLIDGEYKFIEIYNNKANLKAYGNIGKEYTELRGLESIPWDSFLHVLESHNCYSYVTNNGVNKATSQRLVDNNILIPSGSSMYSDVYVKIPAGTVELNECDGYDAMYCIYSDYDKNRTSVYPGISSRALLLNAADKYGAIRITNCQLSNNRLIGITYNGETFGRSLCCGNYLHGIALVKTSKNDVKNYREDTIFKYVYLKPILVKAGSNLVVHVIK